MACNMLSLMDLPLIRFLFSRLHFWHDCLLLSTLWAVIPQSSLNQILLIFLGPISSSMQPFLVILAWITYLLHWSALIFCISPKAFLAYFLMTFMNIKKTQIPEDRIILYTLQWLNHMVGPDAWICSLRLSQNANSNVVSRVCVCVCICMSA